jgi:hypothetical protein
VPTRLHDRDLVGPTFSCSSDQARAQGVTREQIAIQKVVATISTTPNAVMTPMPIQTENPHDQLSGSMSVTARPPS